MTLFAASPRPAARQPAAALRGPKSESRGAAGAPSGLRDTGPAPPQPLARPGRFALAQAESTDPNPNAAPLIFESARSRLPRNAS